jgi:CHAD domain-containing protein
MPYQLQKDEAPADGLKRILEEQISGAVRCLQGPQDLNCRIYEARKFLKRARSVLRLLQDPLHAIYREENRRLRDVARRFGSLRDTHVSLELLEKFAERYKRKSALNQPRHKLAAKQDALEKATDWETALKESVETLMAIRKRMEDWPTLLMSEESVQAALQKTRKQSRHAFEKAKKTRTAEDFHELRKSVKRELNQARVVNGPGIESLKRLAALLGDHHNLAVLMANVENASGRFLGLIRQQMRELETSIIAMHTLTGESTAA